MTAQQCSLVDATPVLRAANVSGDDFPITAMQWGFEGWVKVEFDVAADGWTERQRAVVAYPPFVFRDAAVGIVKGFRYTQSYRPEGGTGCSGAAHTIRFLLPG